MIAGTCTATGRPSAQPAEAREVARRIDVPGSGKRLLLRELPAVRSNGLSPVLYVHGATFPSALSVAYRFDGRSWRDALNDAGFDVWALDFLGFGGSDRYPEMDEPADAHGPLCLAADAVGQLKAAIRFVMRTRGAARVSLITHSWGSMPAGLLAAAHPVLVDCLFMVAPPVCRDGTRYEPLPTLPAWKIVTNEDQWARFVEDVPDGEPFVLPRGDFDAWAQTYLDSDPGSRERDPPGVKTPTGPLTEILRAWHGAVAWEPEKVEAPVAIARGDWTGCAARRTRAGCSTGWSALASGASSRSAAART